MGDWPAREDRWGLGWTISAAHSLSLGGVAVNIVAGGAAPTGSVAWPAANRAILIPFRLPRLATVYKATVGNGTTASGNFDVGVYDIAGNRLVSSGATSKGASTETNVDLTDTLLGPGRYYMALSANGTQNYSAHTGNLYMWKLCGVRQASSAYVLPATVTFETIASAYLPVFQLRLRSY